MNVQITWPLDVKVDKTTKNVPNELHFHRILDLLYIIFLRHSFAMFLEP